MYCTFCALERHTYLSNLSVVLHIWKICSHSCCTQNASTKFYLTTFMVPCEFCVPVNVFAANFFLWVCVFAHVWYHAYVDQSRPNNLLKRLFFSLSLFQSHYFTQIKNKKFYICISFWDWLIFIFRWLVNFIGFVTKLVHIHFSLWVYEKDAELKREWLWA